MKSIPKVGDKLRVRDWEDMEREFGLDRDGDIKCTPFFIEEMRKFCGKVVNVNYVAYDKYDEKLKIGIYEDNGEYEWSVDMFCGPVPAMKHRSLQLYLQQRRAQS